MAAVDSASVTSCRSEFAEMRERRGGGDERDASEARPLNPSMEVEGKKNQSSFSVLVKEKYVANKEEISGGPPVLYSPPSHIGTHGMSAGPRVHDGEYVLVDKGPVPPSTPNPTTHDP
nr:hypothetical protein CFP56_28399 [Quercus suber]